MLSSSSEKRLEPKLLRVENNGSRVRDGGFELLANQFGECTLRVALSWRSLTAGVAVYVGVDIDVDVEMRRRCICRCKKRRSRGRCTDIPGTFYGHSMEDLSIFCERSQNIIWTFYERSIGVRIGLASKLCFGPTSAIRLCRLGVCVCWLR